jgi:A/G-specific adenine glycosylase
MELGATVCGPNRKPDCEHCPCKAFCLGYAHRTAEALPVKKAKPQRRAEEKTVFILSCDGFYALHKRPEKGLLAGLWEFPHVEGTLNEESAPAVVDAWGLEPKAWKNKLTAKHIFTHVEWHMTGYTLEVAGEGPEEFFWADLEELRSRAVPSAFARYYGEAEKELEERK